MLASLKKITTWQVALIIFLVGFAVYFDGLQNQFMGDDLVQIVNSLPAHSISNIRIFFDGGTFYAGQPNHLIGAYYRPLMITVFALIYTIFGAQANFFHLFQLLLCMGSAFILYLFFKRFFKPWLSLTLSLVFLIHPIDSQVVFEIASMQDALYFFFGILALYLLSRYTSKRALILPTLCLLLALLAKETAILFFALSVLYLFWYGRKRLIPFLGMLLAATAVYLGLRVHAIGWFLNSGNAPIDRLGMAGRLFTAPSIVLMYLTKLIFPWKLASWYYWTNPRFSLTHFLLPLIVDIAILCAVVYVARSIRKTSSKANYQAFVFFAIWSGLGLLMIIQILPLDFTASLPWFYFPMVGFLGMLGLIVKVFGHSVRVNSQIIFGIVVLILVLLGVRTAIWGRAWSSDYNLAVHNIAAVGHDFQSDNEIATNDYNNGDYYDAELYAKRSVAEFPYATNYNVLGATLTQLGDYPGAYKALHKGLQYLQLCSIYDNLSILTFYYGSPYPNQRFLIKAVSFCPEDPTPWFFLAVLDYDYGNIKGGKYAITEAYRFYNSSVSFPIPGVYQKIMENEPLDISS